MTIMTWDRRTGMIITTTTATNRLVKTGTIIGLAAVASLAAAAYWWSNSAERGSIAKGTSLTANATAADSPSAGSTPTATGPDPRAQLKTAIPDIVRLLEANDFATYLQEYMPPDKLAAMIKATNLTFDQIVTTAKTNPVFQRQAHLEVAILKTLGGITPAVNAAGDEATYPINPANFSSYTIPGDPRIPSGVNFVKITGQWHLITE